MQTPAFKKTADQALLESESSSLKPLPPLAAVYIAQSRFAVLLYRCGYGAFALSLLLVFYPFVIAQPFWLLGLILCYAGLWWAYHQQLKSCITCAIRFADGSWWLEQDGNCSQMELAGDVLCWLWLIILPLRNVANDSTKGKGEVRQVMVFNDSLSSSDNARLRRWLRACLVPKG